MTKRGRKALCRAAAGILIPCMIVSCAAMKSRKADDVSAIDRQILKIRQEIDRLYGKLAEMFGRLNNHDRMISDLEVDLESEPPVPTAAEPAETQPEINASQIPEIYAAAMSAYEEKDYDAALQGFETVFITAPENDLADNAAYWAGECRYSQNAYPDALARFEDVLSRFPRGNKKPDALLKTGYCQLAMGNEKDARRIFEQVIRDYPSHHVAEKARKKRARAG